MSGGSIGARALAAIGKKRSIAPDGYCVA